MRPGSMFYNVLNFKDLVFNDKSLDSEQNVVNYSIIPFDFPYDIYSNSFPITSSFELDKSDYQYISGLLPLDGV